MGLRRTFFGWQHINSGWVVDTARGDLAAGRVPWVSLKPRSTWAQLAAGTDDAELDRVIAELAALDGPVWFTLHHEPENDTPDQTKNPVVGTSAEWRAAQRHVRARLDANPGAANIAFAPILMSWTWDQRSGRTPLDWWMEDTWDFIGVDHYVDSTTTASMRTVAYENARAFIGARGYKMALGEWGLRGSDGAAAGKHDAFYQHMVNSTSDGGAQVIGAAYFDSALNSPSGSWELAGAQLTKFHELLAAPTSVTATHQADPPG